MNSRIFPPTVVKSLGDPGKASYEKKCLFHERLLYHYLMRKIEGWSIKNFLEIEKIEKYALYAVTDFTTLFIKDLEKNGGDRPEIICDKNAGGFYHGVLGYVVSTPDEMLHLYRNARIQNIIIMSVLHENEIIDELLRREVQLQDMISIINILYS